MPALYHYQHAALTRGRQLCATFFFFPPRFFASLPVPLHRGGSRILREATRKLGSQGGFRGGGGGVLNNIPKPGGGGGGGGGEGVLEGINRRVPPVTARGSGGALIAPQWGLGLRPSSFLHLRLFSMKMNILLTVISPPYNLILITS